VTLALTRPTTTPTTISIAGDSSGLQTQVQAFVTAYNAVVTGGHTAAGYGQTAASNALLQGDSGIRSTLDQLSDIMGEEVPGSTGAYTTMASVGINLNADGTLAFDTTQFASALAADPASVTRLFVTDSSNGSTGLMSTLGSAVDSLTTPTTGAISAEIDAWTSRATDLTSRISDAQTRVTAYQTQLQTEFTQMNAMLAQYKQQSSALTSAFDSSSTSSSSSSSNSIP
jgi:flagellar hook-associated protein 2